MCRVRQSLQLTLALLKPDVIANPIVATEIKESILRNGFLFVQSRYLRLNREKAEEFYHEHKGRFFYNRLVSFMSSGPISAHILARDDAIRHWRQLMGPTKVFKTVYECPNSLRGRFGLTDTRNSMHGSDSETTAAREIAFFFPEFDIAHWYATDGECYLNRHVDFDDIRWEHRPRKTGASVQIGTWRTDSSLLVNKTVYTECIYRYVRLVYSCEYFGGRPMCVYVG